MGKMKDTTIPDYDQHSHDPMCPQYDCWLEGCTVCDECALIARVREDEQAAALDAAREVVAGLAGETYCDSAPCWGAERYLAAIDALRGER